VIRQAALYLPTADDVHTALLPVVGQPVAFRALVHAVRAGARSVGVPAVFRGTPVEAAIDASARIRMATVWLDREHLADTATALVPVSALTPPAALAALLATPPPAMLAAAAGDGAAIVVADARLTTALAPALSAGTPVGHEIGRALRSRDATIVARGAWHVHVRDAPTARRAEDHLFAALGSAIDTRLDRALHRRLSRPVTRTAIALGITPNQISVASLLVGLAAAWCFWVGTPVAAVVGLLVYVAAVVLDHADGEVARLTFAESRVGEWLDILVDTLVHATMVIAMGLAAERIAGGGSLLGVVGALGVVASAAVAKVWPATGGVDNVGAALEKLGSRDGFYAMLLLFIAARALAPGALPSLMIVVALGSQAYWLTRAAYTLRARAGRRKTARRPK
jgi:phosphatidylglycerophosphate synthase